MKTYSQLMKGLLRYQSVAVTMLSIFLFAGCSKDDEKKPENYGLYTFLGEDYEVTQGYIVPDTDNGWIDLLLLDDGYHVTEENGAITDIEGKGESLLVTFVPFTQGELSAGAYSFNDFDHRNSLDDDSSPLPGDFVGDRRFVYKDNVTYDEYACTGGRVTVSLSDNRYNIEFDLEYRKYLKNDSYGTSIYHLSGSFSGELETYRWEGD